MIGSIGPKRTILIIALAGVIAVLAALNYFVLEPQALKTKRTLDGVMAESMTLRTEVEKMRADFITAQKQKAFFDSITRMGFFNDQDRVIARQRFDTMQKLSKIISARYEIRPATLIADENADRTGYVVMESPVTVSLSAVDDLDIYRFVYYLNYGFPGHVTISNLNVERKGDVTPTALKQIGTGSPPDLITARMDLQWRTMARKDAIDVQNVMPTSSVGGAQQ